MARFTVRVELHGGNGDDYEVLHEAMENKGFSRLIADRYGNLFHLPPAEYSIQGAFTRAQVAAMARDAAKATMCDSAGLVTQSAGRYHWGLEPYEGDEE